MLFRAAPTALGSLIQSKRVLGTKGGLLREPEIKQRIILEFSGVKNATRNMCWLYNLVAGVGTCPLER